MLALIAATATFAVAQDAPSQNAEEPKVVSGHPPNFSRCSKPAPGEKLLVLVGLDITAEGSPDEVAVDHSSGDPCLDDSAVAAVQQYHFRPARRDGKPIETHIRIRVDVERYPSGTTSH